MFVVRRSPNNPLLKPVKEHSWESYATFNWCSIKEDSVVRYVYRAMSEPQILKNQKMFTSSIGYTESTDGKTFSPRRQLLTPGEEWEKFGCEDPRITKLDDKYYIFYTALSVFPFAAEGIKAAVAVSDNLLTGNLEKHLVTPFNAKAMTLFPEKIRGKLVALLTVNPDKPPAKIAIAEFSSDEEMWSEDYWQNFLSELDSHTLDLRRYDSDHAEIGAPPIKTKYGWLLVYSHIQDYFSSRPTFGIEALLLDTNDPQKIIGRTKGPMFVPEEVYELYGHVPNIVFPTGAYLENSDLVICYGGADTVCCEARVNFQHLLTTILSSTGSEVLISRYHQNPILSPIRDHPFEAKAVCNPAAIELDGKIHILYRAQSEENVSTIGYASSKDGVTIDQRLDRPIYVPREEFEKSKSPGVNSGCEDPRLVEFEDKIYMFYTAFNGRDPWGVAVSHIKTADFLQKKWNWSSPILVTAKGIENKDTCIFPEKINGKFLLIHRVEPHICIDYVDNLEFSKEQVDKCIQLLSPRRGMWDSVKVGITSPPLRTDKGWLIFYHGVSPHGFYRVGAALLDLSDPTSVIARTSAPIMVPEAPYEVSGLVNNVVFPCGVVNRGGILYIYYGGADQVVGVATVQLSRLLDILSPNAKI